MFKHRIETSLSKTLYGISMEMSFAENKTAVLWRNFMQIRKEFQEPLNPDLYSLQIYPKNFFKEFNAQKTFKKYALVELKEVLQLPENAEKFELIEGLYLVIDFKGDGAMFQEMFLYVLNTLLPQLGYKMDNRPHFEILGEKYKNMDPNSEEEVWIPIHPIS